MLVRINCFIIFGSKEANDSSVAKGGQPPQAPVARGHQKGTKKYKNGLWAPKILSTPLFAPGAKFTRHATDE